MAPASRRNRLVSAAIAVDPIPDGPEKVIEALPPFHAALDSAQVVDLIGLVNLRFVFPSTDYKEVLLARLRHRAD